jgi:hypothetical protein
MLRLAALTIMGLGAALLTAAVLLTTYTAGKIQKIPLNIDKSLVSSGSGTALDPASLQATRFVIDKNIPLVSQQAVTVETPANAQVVTFQVGTTVRRTDKQLDTMVPLILQSMRGLILQQQPGAQASTGGARHGGRQMGR